MLEFLQNNWGSLMVGAIILAVVVLIVIKLVRDRKAGKFTCGGNCGPAAPAKGIAAHAPRRTLAPEAENKLRQPHPS